MQQLIDGTLNGSLLKASPNMQMIAHLIKPPGENLPV